MTVDDDSSIYVGGLPYDSTEDSLRRIFDLYGAVVAVKIINDRSTRGKCYGFVTFTNPRSAIDAIKDMDGRTIDGRVVRVNGVKTRGGGRFGREIGRESNRYNVERDADWDRDRDRGRDYDHDRYRHRGRNNDWSRERDRSRELDLDKDRGYEHAQDRDLPKDKLLDREPELEKTSKDNEQVHDLNHDPDWEKDHDLEWNQGRDIDNTDAYDKDLDNDRDQLSRRDNGLTIEGRTGRDLSSDSSDDYIHELKGQLEISTERFEDLKREISHIEERTGEKGKVVVDLQKKAKKLEDALISAKKRSSFRQMQLTKLHKCFLLVKDYSERLKSSEQELQVLVESTAIESDVG